MSWFRVDDSFASHPKTRSIPRTIRRAVVGTWTILGTYSSRHLTDGLIAKDNVIDEGGTAGDIKALVESRLWHGPGQSCNHPGDQCPGEPPAGHYQYHDWFVYQRSREEVLADRAAAAERQRKAREKAKASREQSRRDSQRDSQGSSSVSHGPPDPTRPDPSLVLGSPRAENESLVMRGPSSATGEIVAAWSQRCRDRGVSPITDQSSLVGRYTKELLDAGNEFGLVMDAAVLAADVSKPFIHDFIGPAVEARRKVANTLVSAHDPVWGATLGAGQ